MGPNRVQKPGAKQGQKRATAENAPTIEKDEVAEANATAKPKRRRGRSVDQAVVKAIRDNFASWTEQETDLNLVDGVSLRERIRYDKQKILDGDATLVMGKHYYGARRQEYGSDSLPQNQFVTKNPDEPEDDDLNQALVAILSHKRGFSDLTEWIEHSPAPNQKVLVCLYRAALNFIKPMASMEQCTIVLQLMKYTIKHDLQKKYPEEVALMHWHFDSACCRSVTSYKAHGLTSNKWWDAHKDIAALLVPPASTRRCMEHNGAWGAVETELIEVINSSDLGRRLFLKPSQALLQQRFAKCASDAVAWLKDKTITQPTVADARQKFEQSIKALGGCPTSTFPPMDINVNYRGCVVPIAVVSHNDQFNSNSHAYLHAVAVVTKAFPSLWSEEDLVEPNAFDIGSTTVHEDPVQESKRAREAAVNLTASEDASSGEAIKTILLKKKAFLQSIDKFFGVEASFFTSHLGDRADARIRQKIMDALPTEDKLYEVKDSMVAFKNLEGSKLLEFAGPGPSSVFQSMLKHLKTIQDQRSPTWPSSPCPFVSQVQDRMGLFLAQDKVVEEETKTLRGTPAAKHSFAMLTEKKSGGRDLAFKEITPLIVFLWLLPSADQKVVKLWSAELLSTIAAERSDFSGSAAPKKRAKLTRSKDDLKAMVAQLYK